MSLPIKDIPIRCHIDSWTKTQVITLSLVALVATAAITLGVLALQARAGVDIGAFHCLGSMGYMGAYTLIGAGNLTLGLSIVFYIDKLISRAELKQKLKQKLKPVIKENEKNIKQQFDNLNNAQMHNKRPVVGKFCHWQPEPKEGETQSYVFVFQQTVEGNCRAIDIFVQKRRDENALFEGKCQQFTEKLSDAGYLFMTGFWQEDSEHMYGNE